MDALITAIRPQDVAREVESILQRGKVNRFVLRPVARGGMLDQERLGAARYAAGVQAVVVLEVAGEYRRGRIGLLELHRVAAAGDTANARAIDGLVEPRRR